MQFFFYQYSDKLRLQKTGMCEAFDILKKTVEVSIDTLYKCISELGKHSDCAN